MDMRGEKKFFSKSDGHFAELCVKKVFIEIKFGAFFLLLMRTIECIMRRRYETMHERKTQFYDIAMRSNFTIAKKNIGN